MAVAHLSEQLLASIPLVYGRTLREFFNTMLVEIPSTHRIEFISEIIKTQNNLLPKLDWSNGKSDEKSKHFRDLGNRCFSRWEYVEALKYYNKAMAYAESIENLGLCFANRSAVYFELSLFKICLENIAAARKCKLSNSLKAKLDVRHERAQHELLTKPFDETLRTYEMKLCRSPKQSQPFYIDCLRKRDNDMIATEQLQAGDVISSEKPYSQMLCKSHIYERCTYCLTNKKFLSMIPCRLCSSAMFCNAFCYAMAMRIFHHFECPMIGGLFRFLPDSLYLGFRTVLISLHECDGSMDEYRNRLMRCFHNDSDPFDVNVVRDENYNEMVFLMVHNLGRSFRFSMQHHVATAVLIDQLKANFGSMFDHPYAEIVLSTSLFHMLQVSQENSVPLEETSFSGDGIGNDITIFGCGLYPFASNFKLGCTPNVLLVNNNGAMVGIALRPIERGEEITPGIMSRNHFLTDRQRRTKRMWACNSPLCHCRACEEDYELYIELPPMRPHRNHPLLPPIPDTCADTVETLLALKLVCLYLNKNRYLPHVSRERGWSVQQMVRLIRQVVLAYGADLLFTEYSKLVRNS